MVICVKAVRVLIAQIIMLAHAPGALIDYECIRMPLAYRLLLVLVAACVLLDGVCL